MFPNSKHSYGMHLLSGSGVYTKSDRTSQAASLPLALAVSALRSITIQVA